MIVVFKTLEECLDIDSALRFIPESYISRMQNKSVKINMIYLEGNSYFKIDGWVVPLSFVHIPMLGLFNKDGRIYGH